MLSHSFCFVVIINYFVSLDSDTFFSLACTSKTVRKSLEGARISIDIDFRCTDDGTNPALTTPLYLRALRPDIYAVSVTSKQCPVEDGVVPVFLSSGEHRICKFLTSTEGEEWELVTKLSPYLRELTIRPLIIHGSILGVAGAEPVSLPSMPYLERLNLHMHVQYVENDDLVSPKLSLNSLSPNLRHLDFKCTFDDIWLYTGPITLVAPVGRHLYDILPNLVDLTLEYAQFDCRTITLPPRLRNVDLTEVAGMTRVVVPASVLSLKITNTRFYESELQELSIEATGCCLEELELEGHPQLVLGELPPSILDLHLTAIPKFQIQDLPPCRRIHAESLASVSGKFVCPPSCEYLYLATFDNLNEVLYRGPPPSVLKLTELPILEYIGTEDGQASLAGIKSLSLTECPQFRDFQLVDGVATVELESMAYSSERLVVPASCKSLRVRYLNIKELVLQGCSTSIALNCLHELERIRAENTAIPVVPGENWVSWEVTSCRLLREVPLPQCVENVRLQYLYSVERIDLPCSCKILTMLQLEKLRNIVFQGCSPTRIVFNDLPNLENVQARDGAVVPACLYRILPKWWKVLNPWRPTRCLRDHDLPPHWPAYRYPAGTTRALGHPEYQPTNFNYVFQ